MFYIDLLFFEIFILLVDNDSATHIDYIYLEYNFIFVA